MNCLAWFILLTTVTICDGEKKRGGLALETLAQVVSLAEENRQDQSKAEGRRQMGLNLDSTLAVQTKRQYVSKMPATVKDRRDKYKVMIHMWLLAQRRQPGRPLRADFSESTFNRFLMNYFAPRLFSWIGREPREVLRIPVGRFCHPRRNLVSFSRPSPQNEALGNSVNHLGCQSTLRKGGGTNENVLWQDASNGMSYDDVCAIAWKGHNVGDEWASG